MTDADRGPLPGLLGEVAAELARQDSKWGEQNHPDGTGPTVEWVVPGPAEQVRHTLQAVTDEAAHRGTLTWRHIAAEELAEALAEEDASKLRTELVQLAAVCVQWAEAIDRRAQQ